MDIEATLDGTVRKLFIKEGETIPVTLPIAIVGGETEDIADMEKDALHKLGREGETGAQAAASEKDAMEKKDRACAEDSSGYDYEVAVIGGGPGGYVAAIKAAQMGKKTVLIEKEHVGGTCLNEGCIPTKVLLRSAEALKAVEESKVFGVAGIDLSGARLDLEKVQERKRGIIRQLVGGVQSLLKGNGVTVIQGEGVLEKAHTIKAGGRTITAADIIIATGSQVKNLPIKIDPKAKILTSREVLELAEKPKSAVVIGGGVIGIEFAYFLASIGVSVSVVEFMDRILPMVDEEITAKVTEDLKRMGIQIYTSAKVTEVTAEAVLFEKDGKRQEAQGEIVLMAVGRAPELSGIDTEALGIKTERGAIVTDGRLKTSAAHIYAVGDANGKSMLAHTASMEGIVAVKNICGEAAVMAYDKIPSAIYIQPEIACVGLTEKQAAERYKNVKVGRFPLMANGKAKVAGEERGLVKVITEPKYGEIVGVHIYGIHATDMIGEAVVAMNLEGTAEETAMAIHPHPTVSESIQEAMHAAAGRAIHI